MVVAANELKKKVRRIEDDGFIQVDRLGGIPEKVLPGLNVQILTKDGEVVDGVFGNKSHHATAESDKYKVDLVTSFSSISGPHPHSR